MNQLIAQPGCVIAQRVTLAEMSCTDNDCEGKSRIAKVVSVGQGKFEDGHYTEMTFNPDDLIVIGAYGSDDVTLDGVGYIIVDVVMIDSER